MNRTSGEWLQELAEIEDEDLRQEFREREFPCCDGDCGEADCTRCHPEIQEEVEA